MKQRQFVQPAVASGASLSGENSALGAAPPVSSILTTMYPCRSNMNFSSGVMENLPLFDNKQHKRWRHIRCPIFCKQTPM